MEQTPSFSLKSWTAEFLPGGRGPNISIKKKYSFSVDLQASKKMRKCALDSRGPSDFAIVPQGCVYSSELSWRVGPLQASPK